VKIYFGCGQENVPYNNYYITIIPYNGIEALLKTSTEFFLNVSHHNKCKKRCYPYIGH
jgi:hypothetical protein